MTRALSQRPTTLPLGSMYLLMECSKGSMHPFILKTTMRIFSWEGSSMDLTFNLLTMHGKKCIFVLICNFTKYLHSLTIYVQCISPQEGKIIFWFHGHSRTNIYDGDSPYLHGFGKMWCYYCYSQLIYSSIYYFLVDEKKCTGSNLLGDNLPHDVLKQQLVKLCCIHWRNHGYHPKFHINSVSF